MYRRSLITALVVAGIGILALFGGGVGADAATPAAAPSPTSTPPGPCPPVASPGFIVYGGPVARSGTPVDISVQAPSDYGNVKVRVTRADTSTATILYDGPIDADNRVDLDYQPFVNTRVTLNAIAQHPSQCGGYGSATRSVDLFARSLVELLEAQRPATRTYVFRGFVSGHPRDLVNLYREDQYGRPVLTASATTGADGGYVIRRTFSGTGTFVFYTTSPSDPINAGGVSNRIRTTIK
jgi:hypothetical protein